MISFIEMLVERRFRRGHGGEDENPYGTSTTTTITIHTTTTTSEPEPSDDNDCLTFMIPVLNGLPMVSANQLSLHVEKVVEHVTSDRQ